MALRQTLKDSARDGIARLRSRLKGTYDTYAPAKAQCRGAAYEDERLIELVGEKTRKLIGELQAADDSRECDEATLALFGALQAARGQGQTLEVVDFGGAFGAHYYLARRMLPAQTALHWRVVESPSMARAAENQPHAAELAFLSNMEEIRPMAANADVVYASNAVQYSPDPMATLSGLLAMRASSVCICKLTLNSAISAPVFTRQRSRLRENGPSRAVIANSDIVIEYPLAILPFGKTLEMMSASHRLLLHYRHPSILFHSKCGRVEYHTFLLRRVK